MTDSGLRGDAAPSAGPLMFRVAGRQGGGAVYASEQHAEQAMEAWSAYPELSLFGVCSPKSGMGKGHGNIQASAVPTIGLVGSGGDDDEEVGCCGVAESKGSTPFQAGVSIAKCVIGSGSFYLPYAFSQSGFWGGIVGLLVLALLATYTNWLVIKCKDKLFPDGPSSYYDVAKATFGKAVGISMYISILMGGIFTCSVYLVTCGTLLKSVDPRFTMIEVVAGLCVLELLLSWFKSFRYLAYTSIFGDLALLFGVGVTLAYALGDHGLRHGPSDLPAFKVKTFPNFFGIAAFLFSIPSLLFPIENSMLEPRKFKKTLLGSFAFVTCLNLLFGVLCYCCFGSDVDQIVLANLPKTWVVQAVRVALVVDLTFTYIPLILPSRDILEFSLFGRSSTVPHWKKCCVRGVLVLVTGGVAVGVPNITALVNLLAGISVAYNSFILCPLVYMALYVGELSSQGFYFTRTNDRVSSRVVTSVPIPTSAAWYHAGTSAGEDPEWPKEDAGHGDSSADERSPLIEASGDGGQSPPVRWITRKPSKASVALQLGIHASLVLFGLVAGVTTVWQGVVSIMHE